jgi:hypothetical protein
MNRLLTLAAVFFAASLASAGDYGHSGKEVSYTTHFDWRGDFEVSLGHTFLHGNDFSGGEAEDYWQADFTLQLGRFLDEDTFFQFDLELDRVLGNEANDSFATGGLLAAHLMKRHQGGGLGVFGGFLVTDQDDDDTDTSERYFLGLESHDYSPSWTQFAQVGFFGGESGSDDDGEDSIREAFFGRVGVRKYLNESLSVQAEIFGATGEMDADAEVATVLGFALVGEKQLTDRSTLSLGYSQSRVEQGGERDIINDHYLFVSFKHLFDEGSLISRDRTSTSLDLPQLIRWSALTGGPLE